MRVRQFGDDYFDKYRDGIRGNGHGALDEKIAGSQGRVKRSKEI